MRGAVFSSRRSIRAALLCGASALACLVAAGLAAPAAAQSVEELAPSVPAGTQMLLEADTLVYDNDKQTVTAVGGVQIDYGGNRLVAQRVQYDRKTRRLVASGNAQLVQSDGTKINSEHIDLTDDFGDGFVNALRVETTEKTYFGAESAERMGGVLTTFFNGVYTACEPCEKKPDKAPIWRLKARQIIWNGEKKTVRFENSNFEFFGFPIAYLPAFEIADPTVKRKSGFLMPGLAFKSHLAPVSAFPTIWRWLPPTISPPAAPTIPSRVSWARRNGASASTTASTASRSPACASRTRTPSISTRSIAAIRASRRGSAA